MISFNSVPQCNFIFSICKNPNVVSHLEPTSAARSYKGTFSSDGQSTSRLAPNITGIYAHPNAHCHKVADKPMTVSHAYNVCVCVCESAFFIFLFEHRECVLVLIIFMISTEQCHSAAFVLHSLRSI